MALCCFRAPDGSRCCTAVGAIHSHPWITRGDEIQQLIAKSAENWVSGHSTPYEFPYHLLTRTGGPAGEHKAKQDEGKRGNQITLPYSNLQTRGPGLFRKADVPVLCGGCYPLRPVRLRPYSCSLWS
ncbi:hypothetical protein SRHO_G00275630 [Serrasalmus rhombeus]